MPILLSRSRGSVIQMVKVGNHDSLPTVTPKNHYTLHSAVRASCYQSATSKHQYQSPLTVNQSINQSFI